MKFAIVMTSLAVASIASGCTSQERALYNGSGVTTHRERTAVYSYEGGALACIVLLDHQTDPHEITLGGSKRSIELGPRTVAEFNLQDGRTIDIHWQGDRLFINSQEFAKEDGVVFLCSTQADIEAEQLRITFDVDEVQPDLSSIDILIQVKLAAASNSHPRLQEWLEAGSGAP